MSSSCSRKCSEHRSRADGGLGIGLSLVRKLVELHHGVVAAASPGAGQGSVFTVRLPLVEQVTTPKQFERVVLGHGVNFRHRILVVDDNQDAATSLAILLSELGHDVDTAFGAHDGIAKAAAMRPTLMFLDLGMPHMNGIEAAKHVRALPHGDDITLVALTGWGQALDHQRTSAAGFDGHLVKPIDLGELDKLLSAPVIRNGTSAAMWPGTNVSAPGTIIGPRRLYAKYNIAKITPRPRIAEECDQDTCTTKGREPANRPASKPST